MFKTTSSNMAIAKLEVYECSRKYITFKHPEWPTGRKAKELRVTSFHQWHSSEAKAKIFLFEKLEKKIVCFQQYLSEVKKELLFLSSINNS